jgi:uncharacterized protein (TIGR02996 family)
MGTMPTRDEFLQAIIANRDDDGPRLVYADWLEEQGEGERAELIRVQCEEAKLPECRACAFAANGPCDNPIHALRRRAAVLLQQFGGEWFRADRGMDKGAPLDRKAWRFRAITSMTRYRYWLGYQRGLLGIFEGPAADFLTHADALVAAMPLGRVW